MIQGVVQDENARAAGTCDCGHAGLFATAIDIARFADCLLRGGEPLFRPSTVELFTTPAMGSRTLGWDTPTPPSQAGRYFGPRSFGHLGYTGTSLWCDPERGVSITLLTNRTFPDPHATEDKIKKVRPLFHDAIMEELIQR